MAQSYFSVFMPNLATFQGCWQATLIQGQRVPDAISSLSLLHQKVVCQEPLAEVEQRAGKLNWWISWRQHLWSGHLGSVCVFMRGWCGAVGRSRAGLGLVWDWFRTGLMGTGPHTHCRELVPSPGRGEGSWRAMGMLPALARLDFPPVIKHCSSF